MKILHKQLKSFTKASNPLAGNTTISTDYNSFIFGNYLATNSIQIPVESSYDSVIFNVWLKVSSITSGSSVGLFLNSATDSASAEKVVFLFEADTVKHYINGSLISTTTLSETLTNAKLYKLSLARIDNTYTFYINDKKAVTYIGLNFKQNVKLSITGAKLQCRLLLVENITKVDDIKVAILGDSISNQSYLAVNKSLKGILNNRQMNVGEFSGDANIVKDTLDSIDEVISIKPKYAIIIYGHNDTLFNTGDLQADLTTLKTTSLANNITPIFCTIPPANDITISTPNTIITTNFSDGLFIDLSTAYLLADTTDGVHPNETGAFKMANVIYDYIKYL